MSDASTPRPVQPYRSVIPGVMLVLVGIAFLGEINNWWHVDWLMLLTLWPLILIFVGLRLLLPRTRWADLFVVLVLALAIAGFFSLPPSMRLPSVVDTTPSESGNASQDGGNATTRLKLGLDVAATRFHLKAADQDDAQLYAAGTKYSKLEQTFARIGDTATANLSAGLGMQLLGGNRPTFDVALSRHPILDLSLNAGASTVDLDLTDLNLSTLNIDGGASTTEIKLGKASARQKVTYQGGASTVRIRVPRDAALSLAKDGGLTGDNFDQLGLTRNANTYTSPNFAIAPLQIAIEFTGGASTINIERY